MGYFVKCFSDFSSNNFVNKLLSNKLLTPKSKHIQKRLITIFLPLSATNIHLTYLPYNT